MDRVFLSRSRLEVLNLLNRPMRNIVRCRIKRRLTGRSRRTRRERAAHRPSVNRRNAPTYFFSRITACTFSARDWQVADGHAHRVFNGDGGRYGSSRVFADAFDFVARADAVLAQARWQMKSVKSAGICDESRKKWSG